MIERAKHRDAAVLLGSWHRSHALAHSHGTCWQVSYGMRRVAPSILLGLELLRNLKPLLDLLNLLPTLLVVHFEHCCLTVICGLS